MINETQRYTLLLPYTDAARKLFVTKLLEKPIQEIKQLSGRIQYDQSLDRIPKYRVYSAHDTQVANILH